MPRVLEKRERSLGVKLSIRGDRASSPKSALTRKPYKPGQHGKRFSKMGEFGTQLREKQKIKFSYGITDRQLKKVFENAHAQKGKSAIDVITSMLERRLDNVVVLLGFAQSRSISRKMVTHGHFLVNGRRVNTPSYELSPGDTVAISASSKNISVFEDLKDKMKNHNVPSWLSLNKDTLEGKVESHPKDVNFPFNINMVVDYYSKK
ncbi:MAG: 30S ribosomal protein S4 [Parcubacteria group bacterium GW2011_GWA1_50_14]|uniref:Small ribosomal subunit protein uS4 n=2 Tax=Candidatus Colwelliibacteriota TaxID=1817904 RepID=A0A1G1ZD67_9BACT|nr:MAG: 30S ribosomal protein S4 [Parcubacteria group bacterium GW2011_GWA1_50_14]OGY57433.1 MAG: 30S ribosomal protein S4 [Candidatus Colwellbacteria bacterium RIFCSPHIGHO2_02_FULL_45_17]OGY61051.1 MAG: 30S ribosomal protein S4 [Candidatus Colwellbacteria bacterium RIFCSPLOWO2_02_FULL_45_11]OGY62538.1 MAG: 30S ribosomal protein S4 [Candidatus Colwellbacteria bacterium RIFCSPLOWO2_12_FULL_46_17]